METFQFPLLFRAGIGYFSSVFVRENTKRIFLVNLVYSKKKEVKIAQQLQISFSCRQDCVLRSPSFPFAFLLSLFFAKMRDEEDDRLGCFAEEETQGGGGDMNEGRGGGGGGKENEKNKRSIGERGKKGSQGQKEKEEGGRTRENGRMWI